MSDLILPPVLINELNTFVDLSTYSDKRFVVSQWMKTLDINISEEKFNGNDIDILYEYYFNGPHDWSIDTILESDKYNVNWLINKKINYKPLVKNIVQKIIKYLYQTAVLQLLISGKTDEQIKIIDVNVFFNSLKNRPREELVELKTKYEINKIQYLIEILPILCLPCYKNKLNNWIDELDPYFPFIGQSNESTFNIQKFIKLKDLVYCYPSPDDLIIALKYRDYTIDEQKILVEYIYNEDMDCTFNLIRATFSLSEKILFSNILSNDELNLLIKGTINFLTSSASSSNENILIFQEADPDLATMNEPGEDFELDCKNTLQKIKTFMSLYDVNENKEFIKALEQLFNCKLDLLYEIFEC